MKDHIDKIMERLSSRNVEEAEEILLEAIRLGFQNLEEQVNTTVMHLNNVIGKLELRHEIYGRVEDREMFEELNLALETLAGKQSSG